MIDLNAPKYLLQKTFLLGSVAFVVVFSFLFLFLYHPFSDTIWLGLDPKNNLVPTLLFYLVCILILFISKELMMLYQIRHTITVGRYILWLTGEFVLIATVYLMFASRYFNP